VAKGSGIWALSSITCASVVQTENVGVRMKGLSATLKTKSGRNNPFVKIDFRPLLILSEGMFFT
jgi:hypothetical protein